MNDQERLGVLLDTLQQLEGLDEERFQRLSAELARGRARAGYDEQGCAMLQGHRITSTESWASPSNFHEERKQRT